MIRCERCKATFQVSFQSSLALERMESVPRCGFCGHGRLHPVEAASPRASSPRSRMTAGAG
jgi:hypothetical protein